MSLGKNIKKLRKESYLTQEELAEKLNVTFQAVSKWENEAGMPDISLIIPIARIFGVSTDELFGVKSEPMKKEGCIHIIRRIVDLSQITRRRGILALELELDEEQNSFLKTAIRLMVNGTMPDELEKILKNLISAGNYSDIELLERQIIMQGTNCLLGGHNPLYTANILLSMLGEEYLTRVDEICPPDNRYKPYVDLMAVLKDKKALPESAAFEERFLSLWKYNIYIIFAEMTTNRSIYEPQFAQALYGCSIGLINHILDHISWGRAMDLCEALLHIHSQNTDSYDHIITAQQHILHVLDQLEKEGKFVQ